MSTASWGVVSRAEVFMRVTSGMGSGSACLAKQESGTTLWACVPFDGQLQQLQRVPVGARDLRRNTLQRSTGYCHIRNSRTANSRPR